MVRSRDQQSPVLSRLCGGDVVVDLLYCDGGIGDPSSIFDVYHHALYSPVDLRACTHTNTSNEYITFI